MKTLLALILLVLGGLITFSANKLASVMLKDKREPNDADTVYIKLAGFALALLAAVILFFI